MSILFSYPYSSSYLLAVPLSTSCKYRCLLSRPQYAIVRCVPKHLSAMMDPWLLCVYLLPTIVSSQDDSSFLSLDTQDGSLFGSELGFEGRDGGSLLDGSFIDGQDGLLRAEASFFGGQQSDGNLFGPPRFLDDTVPVKLLKVEHRGVNCDCMEYWECIRSGGNPYSYCGLSESSVCCILPPTNQHASASEVDSNSTRDSASKPRCGVKGFDSGQYDVAEPSEWPWHVAIVEEPGFFYVCGGSLIDESWVLTAAHCVQPYMNATSAKLKARLGEHDVAASTEALPHEDRAVASIVLHPDFEPTSLSSDLALLRLESPVTQRPHIDVICLPSSQQQLNLRSSCVLTGWGKAKEGGEFSQVLKEVSIPLWDDSDCQIALEKEFGAGFRLNNNTFCAGATGRDACEGDGGGPLVCELDGQWYQQGIVSYGFGCGHRGVPGVYTKVSNFLPWIQKTVLSPPGL